MALTFDYTKIKDYLVLHSDPIEHQISEIIVQGMYVAGVNELTKKAMDDTAMRFALLQVTQPMIVTDKGPTFVTREHLERRIGLHTNVPFVSKTKFLNNLVETIAPYLSNVQDQHFKQTTGRDTSNKLYVPDDIKTASGLILPGQ